MTTKFWKITQPGRKTRTFYVKGEFVPAHGTWLDYVAGARWIKTTQKWSSNRYCFGGDIREITEQEVGA